MVIFPALVSCNSKGNFSTTFLTSVIGCWPGLLLSVTLDIRSPFLTFQYWNIGFFWLVYVEMYPIAMAHENRFGALSSSIFLDAATDAKLIGNLINSALSPRYK